MVSAFRTSSSFSFGPRNPYSDQPFGRILVSNSSRVAHRALVDAGQILVFYQEDCPILKVTGYLDAGALEWTFAPSF